MSFTRRPWPLDRQRRREAEGDQVDFGSNYRTLGWKVLGCVISRSERCVCIEEEIEREDLDPPS